MSNDHIVRFANGIPSWFSPLLATPAKYSVLAYMQPFIKIILAGFLALDFPAYKLVKLSRITSANMTSHDFIYTGRGPRSRASPSLESSDQSIIHVLDSTRSTSLQGDRH